MKRAVLTLSIILFSSYLTARVPGSVYYLTVQSIMPIDKTVEQAKGDVALGFNASLGGYVFYLSPDGSHGLVAATQDQSEASDWYSAQDAISNPANHNADGKKFLDWRLPTRFELNLMYLQRSVIGGFKEIYYWSSVLNGSKYAWMQNFGSGSQDYGSLDVNYRVRAVRTF